MSRAGGQVSRAGERPSKEGRAMHLLTGGKPPFCSWHNRLGDEIRAEYLLQGDDCIE